MVQTVVEMSWLKVIFEVLGVYVAIPILMKCNNKFATYIASNLVFYEWTKYIEVDYHYICDLVHNGIIFMEHITFGERFCSLNLSLLKILLDIVTS